MTPPPPNDKGVSSFRFRYLSTILQGMVLISLLSWLGLRSLAERSLPSPELHASDSQPPLTPPTSPAEKKAASPGSGSNPFLNVYQDLEQRLLQNWEIEVRYLTEIGQEAAGRYTDPEPDTSLAADLEAGPFEIEGEWLDLRLPANVRECQIGKTGDYWVMRADDLPGLICLNIDKRTIGKTIRLPSKHFYYAAGRNNIVVYLPETRHFEIHAYEPDTPVKRTPYPNPNQIIGLGGSHSSSQYLVLTTGSLTGTSHLKQSLKISSLNTHGFHTYYTKAVIPKSSHEAFKYLEDGVEIRIQPEMKSAVLVNRSRRSRLVLLNNISSPVLVTEREMPEEGVTPGQGVYFYSNTGNIYDTDARLQGSLPGRLLIPDTEQQLFASVDCTRPPYLIQLHRGADTFPIATLGTVPKTALQSRTGLPLGKWARPWAAPTKLPPGQRVYLNLKKGCLILIPPGADHCLIRTFDPKILQSKLSRYLVIRSTPSLIPPRGMPWTYRVELNGVNNHNEDAYSFELLQGPKGMFFDFRSGLEWQPSADQKGYPGPYPVTVQVSSPEQGSVLHHFNLYLPE